MKKNIFYIIMALISIAFIIFTYNNYFLYKTPVLKIYEIKNIYSEDINDESIEQTITGVIKNGDNKGKEITLTNETSFSGILDEQIHKNSELFVKLSKNDLSVQEILGIKRDKYLVILLVLFIDLAIVIGGKKGIKSLLTLKINIAISFFTMYLYFTGKLKIDILLFYIPISILFIIVSLILCNGYNKKSAVAIISSIMSLLLSFALSYLVLKCYNSTIYFWNMDYIEIIKDYEQVFYINILLSGLGAIMDISVTMSSSLSELIAKNKKISYKSLKKSGEKISKDILGTMTNVMLFTCYISTIPMLVLVMRNKTTLIDAINAYGQIEMIRILTSCISIVLAIPISLYVALFILKKVKKHD